METNAVLPLCPTAARQNARLVLAPGQVHVWYQWSESIDLRALARARALLSAEELSRCDSYRLDRDRRDYIAAHALLRSSLSRYCEVEPWSWTFATGPHGKPELRHGGTAFTPQFSLSHARGIVACAIAGDAAVGIDVERADVTFDCLPIASRCCSDEENARLRRCAPDDRPVRFVEMWTLKEAYLKATGQGISEAVRHLGFDMEGGQVRLLPAEGVDAHAWQFTMLTVAPDVRIGVAVHCGNAPVWTITRLVP